MKKLDLKDTLELAGIAAIVGSLIFVGLQMRQTHEIALATLYQMRSDAAREVRVAFIDTARMQETFEKSQSGEPLSEADVARIESMAGLALNHFENSHYLYTLGYLPAEHWEGDKNQIAGLIIDNPIAHNFWKENRHEFRASFAEEIDSLGDQ